MQIILGMYVPQTNTCPLVVHTTSVCFSIIIIQHLGKLLNIHSFGALVTTLWGISDRLSISDQINKNSHFITKHVVIKLQYNNYIVM